MTYISIPDNIEIKIYKECVKIISFYGVYIKKKNINLKLFKKGNKLFLLSNKKNDIFFLNLLYKNIIALSKGFYKILILEGVGYKLFIEDKLLRFKLGFSHEVLYTLPEDISVYQKAPNFIIVYGTNFQKVSQIAAEIRALKPPEPYKGKGIRYSNEIIIKKKGKTD